ncbi:amino acid ABC transporter ATP-binding protein [Devosia sp. ZB163]|uniref:amino acid ABC transporter ATP-binding protein n=1 Tax=Devosia sp. ZB163 TaxID=3025938 RepID=UPI002360D327|nr:amino acid ABC transporter ATP-binding protein [Devosia sp. ZB163]MDC9826246.1 amino acid ABC transporter ATP-binding protein [Devosia sp. ZB163]
MTSPAFIRIRDLTKSYGSNRVLDAITLDIREGETRCIIGPSGSGKSTLLRCLNALTGFDSGALVVGSTRVGYTDRDGVLKPWTPREAASFRSRIGFVAQHVNLFSHRTVIENVIEGPVHVLGISDTVARRRAADLLARVGLADKHDSYPIQLSGGQQQRAAIARALAMEPQVMLFDEATSALDPELVAEVLNVMAALSADGMTMVVVTHEMRFAQEAGDRIAVLDAGRLIEDGTADEVFGRPRHARTAEFLKDHFAFSRQPALAG